MKSYISTLFTLFIAASAWAAAPQDMRFHCANDTARINELLSKGAQSGKQSPNALVEFYARELMGTPYVAHTLEGEREWLTINIDELDCTTFVETLYALTRTTLDGRTSWRDYARNLENIRYRDGQLGDYSSRLHYISDWIVNNFHRGNIREITPEIDGARYDVKTLDFMSKHRDSYLQLADSAMWAKVKNFEIGYRMHRYPYLKKEWLDAKKAKAIKSGDFVALVTKAEGLDVSHMGVIIKSGDKLYLLHASSTAKKVVLEKDELKETLRRNRSCTAIRVIRIVE